MLKTQDKYIRFGFLTGVTKFSHVSIFSDLNNLKDISMDCRYADICGITEKELHKYFDGSIRELAEGNGIRFEEASEELRKWYDGYHFCENSEGVYNPFRENGMMGIISARIAREFIIHLACSMHLTHKNLMIIGLRQGRHHFW